MEHARREQREALFSESRHPAVVNEIEERLRCERDIEFRGRDIFQAVSQHLLGQRAGSDHPESTSFFPLRALRRALQECTTHVAPKD